MARSWQVRKLSHGLGPRQPGHLIVHSSMVLHFCLTPSTCLRPNPPPPTTLPRSPLAHLTKLSLTLPSCPYLLLLLLSPFSHNMLLPLSRVPFLPSFMYLLFTFSDLSEISWRIISCLSHSTHSSLHLYQPLSALISPDHASVSSGVFTSSAYLSDCLSALPQHFYIVRNPTWLPYYNVHHSRRQFPLY